MQWNEPCLMQYEFRFGVEQHPATARLGFPRPDDVDHGGWTCSFQIEGLEDGLVRRARGVDGLQALTIASMTIRGSLDRLESVVSNREPL